MSVERVIYARRNGLALESPHRLLGVAGEGAWAAVSDETVHALLAASRPLRILYFGAEEYARAMRGLSAVEIERAARRRLDVFSDRVAAQTLAALMEREGTSLAVAAAGKRRDYVDACLERLANLYGHGYLDTMPLVDAVRMAVVDEVAIVEAETDAGHAAAAARRRAQAQTLAEARAQLGEPAFARALPFVDPIFVFAVATVKPERIAILDHDRTPYALFEGRLIVALPRRMHDDLARDGAVARVAADAGDFVEALDQTEAQRDRDLRELLAAAGSPLADAAALWRRRAAQCMHKRWLAGDRRAEPALVATVRAQLEADVAELVATAPPAGDETLAASHARAEVDARLFALLARQAGLSSLAGDFDETLAQLSATRGLA
ncbi:MAG: hypothetical protein JWN44_3841 [Myxococcales bacterium]|nr:hypothetical protein [Myxococcales bacterium]